MASWVIQVGGTPAVRCGQRRRSSLAVDASLLARIRCAVVVVVLALALCGTAAMTSGAVAGTTPPEGPGPGLDL